MIAAIGGQDLMRLDTVLRPNSQLTGLQSSPPFAGSKDLPYGLILLQCSENCHLGDVTQCDEKWRPEVSLTC